MMIGSGFLLQAKKAVYFTINYCVPYKEVCWWAKEVTKIYLIGKAVVRFLGDCILCLLRGLVNGVVGRMSWATRIRKMVLEQSLRLSGCGRASRHSWHSHQRANYTRSDLLRF